MVRKRNLIFVASLPRTMRSRLVRPLTLVPAETLERHLVVTHLIGAAGSVLDVGGDVRLLSRLLPGSDVVVANIAPPADVLLEGSTLPFESGAFDVVASIDVVEHLPRERRQEHLAELARVARSRLVACWPLGSPRHERVERDLGKWYETTRGRSHPFLEEHLRLGLPDLEASRELASSVSGESRLLFHGDVEKAARRFRELGEARSRPLRYAWRRALDRPDLELLREPRPETNRVFLVVEIDPR
jgi:SAM-dependent methyltransferase